MNNKYLGIAMRWALMSLIVMSLIFFSPVPFSLAGKQGGKFKILGRDFRTYQEKVNALKKEQETLENALGELDSKTIPAIRDIITKRKEAFAEIRSHYDRIKEEENNLKARIRKLNKTIAKLTSPSELAEAWSRYKKSGKTWDAFKKLYRKVRGEEAPNSLHSYWGAEELRIQLEIRNKAVVPIAFALGSIGNIIVEASYGIMDIRAEGQKLMSLVAKATKFSSAKAYSNIKVRFGPRKMRIVKMPKKGKLSLRYVEGLIAEYQSLSAKTQAALLSTKKVTGQIKRDLRVFGSGEKRKKTHLVTDALLAVSTDLADLVDFLGTFGRTKAMAKVKRHYWESYQKAQKGFYGTDQRQIDYELAVEEKEKIQKALDKIKATLEKMSPRIRQFQEEIKKYDKEFADLEGQRQKLLDGIQELADKMENLKVQHDYDEYQEMMAKGGGEKYLAQGLFIHLRTGFWAPDGDHRPQHQMAADSLTAAALLIPWKIRFAVSGGYLSVKQEICEYNDCKEVRTKEGRTKTVCRKRKAMRKYLSGVGNVADLPNIPAAVGRNGLVLVNSKKRLLEGRGVPGVTKVYAKARAAVDTEIDNKAHCRNSLKKVIMGDVTSQNTEEVRIQKVVSVKYTAIQGGQRVKAIDLFKIGSNISGYSYGDYASVFAEAVVSTGGGHTYTVDPKNIYARRLEGDSSFIYQVSSSVIKLRDPVSPGKALLQVALKDLEGNLHFREVIPVTTNVVERKLDLPVRFNKEEYGNLVPIEDFAVYRIIVKGGANMTNYEVRWTPKYEKKGVKFEKTTGFRQVGANKWVSENRVKFTKEWLPLFLSVLRNYGKLPSPIPYFGFDEAKIYRKEDKKQVCGLFNFKTIHPTLPRISGFRIARLGKGVVPVAAFDLFFPCSGNTIVGVLYKGMKLGLETRFQRLRKRIVLPLSFADAVYNGSSALQLHGNELKLGMVGYNYALGHKIGQTTYWAKSSGSGVLMAALDNIKAQHKEISLAKNRIYDTLFITVNRLAVDQVGKKFRLSILGPANMAHYKAQWHLSDNKPRIEGFFKKGGKWISEVPANSEFRMVEVLNKRGSSVGIYMASMLGGYLSRDISVRVTHLSVKGPKVYKEGKLNSFSADMWIWGEFPSQVSDWVYCRWIVGRKYGKVMQVKPLLKLGPHHYRSDATILFWDDPNNVGKEPIVRADIMLKGGGKK